MDLSKYDDLLGRIMQEERHIYPFLDAVFGFLWRRTDFFIMQDKGGKLGFPPGGAEKIILSYLHKWQNCQRTDTVVKPARTQNKKEVIEQSLKVVSQKDERPEDEQPDRISSEKDNTRKVSQPRKDIANCSDTYNGADCGTYRWCQTISDLDVLVPVPEYIKKSKEVNVVVGDSRLTVKVRNNLNPSEWNSLVDDELCFRINKEESMWSLLPGHQISVHCEKCEERWWEALLTSEAKVDTKKFDASRPMSDLSEEEKMKVEEIMWNEERKQLGLKTSEQLRTENILKEAWNIEGSPFKGTEFDPSILSIDGTNSDSN